MENKLRIQKARSRPTLEETFIALALVWAKRSTCTKKYSVGCVLVNPMNQVIASGYNGSPRGLEECDTVGCDDTGDGKFHRVVHAELNSIIMCALNGISCRDARMFISHTPCLRCSQAIIQAGIIEVVFLYDVGDVGATETLLHSAGIKIRQFVGGQSGR